MPGCVLRARMLRPALYDKCHTGAIPKPGKDAIVSFFRAHDAHDPRWTETGVYASSVDRLSRMIRKAPGTRPPVLLPAVASTRPWGRGGGRYPLCASGNPGQCHSTAYSRPSPEDVINAVRKSGPPKQILVTIGSNAGTGSAGPHGAGRGNRRDTAGPEGGDDDIAFTLHGQGIEPLIPGEPV